MKKIEKKGGRYEDIFLISLLREYDLKDTTTERKTEILKKTFPLQNTHFVDSNDDKKNILKTYKQNFEILTKFCPTIDKNQHFVVKVKVESAYTGTNVVSLSRELTNQAQELSVEKNELIKV